MYLPEDVFVALGGDIEDVGGVDLLTLVYAYADGVKAGRTYSARNWAGELARQQGVSYPQFFARLRRAAAGCLSASADEWEMWGLSYPAHCSSLGVVCELSRLLL